MRHHFKDQGEHSDAMPLGYSDELDRQLTAALEDMQRNPPPMPRDEFKMPKRQPRRRRTARKGK